MGFYKIFFLSLLGVLFLASCDNDDDGVLGNGDCVSGTAPITTRSYELQGFTGIRLDQSFDLDLVYDESFSVEAIGEANILEFLTITVDDGILYPRLEGDCFSDFSIRVTVTAPAVSAFDLRGSGNVLVNRAATLEQLSVAVLGSGEISFLGDLEVQESVVLAILGSGDIFLRCETGDLIADITGSGNIDTQGRAEYQKLAINGSGDYEGFLMETDTTEVMITGSGDVNVSVSDLLEVIITGSGDVNYLGDPTLSATITGSGQVRPGNN